MKGIDIFCASQASTAICLSMDQGSSSSPSSSSILLGGRAIDRHNPIIGDGRRFTKGLPTAPCSSHPLPINPKPYHQLQKTRKTSSNKSSSTDQTKKHSSDQKKKTSSKSSDVTKKTSSSKGSDTADCKNKSLDKIIDVKKKGCVKPQGDLFTPPGSSRYLLSDAAFLDGLSDYDPVLALVPVEPNKKPLQTVKQDDESTAPKLSSSSSRSEKPSSNQVVVLRVSLHCKGCAGKVRKHLSRMKGVTSFNVDFAAKKVTIVGDITPLSVLASVSKVKNAQFWPAAPPPDSSAVTSANNQEVKK
ncbi:hypothetical protein Patl1_31952 [Pistacia atlantica]|uniref:Uncharacterized protein n=1 Tax=Pistacia atlantica TaxID=434234 RepID=A0ACC1AP02_9ROSI|nr:hypothetical protein Patl1_31952 [Pistacia atlantica]